MADTTIVNLPAGPAVPDDADLMEGVDVSDTTNNATGENVKWTIAELRAAMGGGPVVQSVNVTAAGGIAFESESGWGVVKGTTGLYAITFPTAAGGNALQAVTGSITAPGPTTIALTCTISDLTSTGCNISTFREDNNTLIDLDFSLIRTTGGA